MEINARIIYGWLREVLKENVRVYWSIHTLHVSELTQCLRKSYFDRKFGHKLTLDANVLITLFGNGIHEAIQEYLRKRGWFVEHPVEFQLRNFGLIGHVDAFEPKNRIALELKTVKTPPEKPFKSHILQLNAYMVMAKAKKGYIVYLGRDGKVKVFEHRFDRKLWRQTIERAFRLHKALLTLTPPPPEHSILCTYCPWKWRCYEKSGGDVRGGRR